MLRNWLLYVLLLMFIFAASWIYGERLLYVALVVFTVMPAASYVLTFILFRMLLVTQTVPHTIVKNETGKLTLCFFNPTPIPFGNIQCLFFTDDFAVVTEAGMIITVNALKQTSHEIPFYTKYRGVFTIGLKTVTTGDFMGLFRLKRRMNKKIEINVLPRIIDMSNFPLAVNLLTEAHSRFDIKDEDYATISDIRPYIPTDSIKRVHWKLTAKRNEWLVKNFQSNALNRVTIIMDSLKLSQRYKEQIILEDRIIELAMGLVRFCLRKGMPVDFMVGEGHTVHCQNPAMFETVYEIGSKLTFAAQPPLNPLAMLSHCLNEVTGYLNAIIMTPQLNAELYERIANGRNNGHYIAVLYFSSQTENGDSEKIYRLLSEGGAPCFRITEESLVSDDV
jgi:uncharacterized protein (DUF58 family)